MNDAGQGRAGGRRRRAPVLAIGAVVLPLVLLVLLELVLRLAGFGHDTALLARVDANGRPYLRDNPGFATLFFPEHLRPQSLPFSVPAQKPQERVRIVLLGGSTAMGMPEPAYGMGPMLEEQLAVRHPGTDVEVLNLASTAANSHVVRRVVASLGPLQPDALVVVLGNDEVAGPYGAGTLLTPAAPSSGRIALSTWARATRVGQLVHRVSTGSGGPQRWRGMAMFAAQRVTHDAPALERGRVHFEENLEAIARAGAQLGVPVVFTTVGVNLRHSGPFASIDASTSGEPARQRFDTAYRAGDRAWERGVADSARTFYQEALSILPTHADLHYRLGRLVLAAGDTAAAVAHLRDAREYDVLRLRADATINGIVRRVSTRHDHVILADLDAALAAVSPAGLPGRETFLDHVHLDFAGNRLAARVLADALELALLERIGAPATADWLGANELATRLAYTPYGRREVLSSVLALIQQPPFATQSDHLEQLEVNTQQLVSLTGTQEPEQIAAMWPMVEGSVAARPQSWLRRMRAAVYLGDAMGEHPRAEQLWRELAEELPHFAAATNGWGRSLAAQGRFPQAVRLFERSLEIDPYQPDVRLQLAASLRRVGADDPATRRRAFELEEGALLLDDTATARTRLRALYEDEVKWSTERGDLARVRILRTKLAAVPAD